QRHQRCPGLGQWAHGSEPAGWRHRLLVHPPAADSAGVQIDAAEGGRGEFGDGIHAADKGDCAVGYLRRMPMTLDVLIQEARKLPRNQQAELLDELLCMVGMEEADVALTPAQQRDLDKRVAEYKAGKAKMIPGDEVMAQLRKR